MAMFELCDHAPQPYRYSFARNWYARDVFAADPATASHSANVTRWIIDQGYTIVNLSASVEGKPDCYFNGSYFMTKDDHVAFAFKMRWC